MFQINLSGKNWTSKTDLKKSNKPGLDKIERRVQNFKILGKKLQLQQDLDHQNFYPIHGDVYP